MKSAGWPAPAKLNLFLHILRQRADGYHELQTAFQFIDLCDELDFEPRTDGRIVRAEGAAGVAEEDDIVVRAAHRLREVSGGGKQGATIAVRKRIPMGGGLGGGSSDAATTLVALNQQWGTGLSAEALAELGLTLGADIPVFIHGRAVWAEGIGERFQPIDPPEPWYLVVRPDCAVSTREIFQAPELTRNSAPTTIRALFGSLPKKVGARPEKVEGQLEKQARNDCEAVVRARYPQVAAALEWLGRHAPARLTGTGSCIFAEFDDESRAHTVAAQLPEQWQGFVVRGCNRSPLVDRLMR